MPYQYIKHIWPGAAFWRIRKLVHNTLVLGLAAILSACVNYQYQSEPIDVDAYLAAGLNTSINSTEFQKFLDTTLPNASWPVSDWTLDHLVLTQLFFNTEISVAIDSIPVEQANQLIARQRINPALNIPLEHHSDTSDSKSPWMIGLLLDFVYEREGKREARITKANKQAELARLNVSSTAWKLQKQLQQAYIDHYSALTIRDMLNDELVILEQIIALLSKRIEAGEASQFEVSVNRLEYQKKQLAVTRQEAQVSDSFQVLIGLLGVNLDARSAIHFEHELLENPRLDLERPDIREIALLNRVDIRSALLEYEIFEAELRLQIENQYPDLTLSPGFIFDQDDKIWALGASWLLPMFHNNDGQIEKALANRKLMQEKFSALQRNIIHKVETSWISYQTSLAAYKQSLALLNEIRKNSDNIRRQYELGYTNQLDLLRSKLEIRRFELSALELKINLINSIFAFKSEIQQSSGTNYNHDDALMNLIQQKLPEAGVIQ